jgi:hypothetical protein
MTLLKSMVRKKGGCAQIKNYLEKDGRSLAIDSNGVSRLESWDKEMDQARIMRHKDEGRKYYHFVIAPDPDDKATLEQVREMAVSWAQERYPDCMWVIDYHDDSDAGGIHAHVIVNSVKLDGYKIQISKNDIREDTLLIQKLSRDLGLSYFADSDGSPTYEDTPEATRQRTSDTPEEPTFRDKLVADIAAAVEESLDNSWNFTSFAAHMRSLGFDAKLTRRGVTYTHPFTFASSGKNFVVRATQSSVPEEITFDGLCDRACVKWERLPILPKSDPKTQDSEVKKSIARKNMYEHVLEKTGGRSWKRDVRRAIDSAVAESTTWPQFVKTMQSYGFDVEKGRRGITVIHPDRIPGTGEHWKVRCTKSNLGNAYTQEAIRLRLIKNEHRPDAVNPATTYDEVIQKALRRHNFDQFALVEFMKVNRDYDCNNLDEARASYNELCARLAAHEEKKNGLLDETDRLSHLMKKDPADASLPDALAKARADVDALQAEMDSTIRDIKSFELGIAALTKIGNHGYIVTTAELRSVRAELELDTTLTPLERQNIYFRYRDMLLKERSEAHLRDRLLREEAQQKKDRRKAKPQKRRYYGVDTHVRGSESVSQNRSAAYTDPRDINDYIRSVEERVNRSDNRNDNDGNRPYGRGI